MKLIGLKQNVSVFFLAELTKLTALEMSIIKHWHGKTFLVHSLHLRSI